jgi:hypothetical protein
VKKKKKETPSIDSRIDRINTKTAGHIDAHAFGIKKVSNLLCWMQSFLLCVYPMKHTPKLQLSNLNKII